LQDALEGQRVQIIKSPTSNGEFFEKYIEDYEEFLKDEMEFLRDYIPHLQL